MKPLVMRRLGFALSMTFCLLSRAPFALANNPPELGVLPGTVLNFMDYFKESLEAIKAQGGDTTISLPQRDYSLGLGPLTVVPEFGEIFPAGSPLMRPLYLVDVPTLPFELRIRHYLPDVPAINRTVVGLTEQHGFTKPHLPPLRWTADGRLGVESQVGGSLAEPAPVSLYLLAPEKLRQPLVDSAPGPQALVLDVNQIPFSQLLPGRTGSLQHTNICDPYHHSPGARRNPYQCGVGGQDDCYDVTLVSSYVRLSNEVANGQTPPKLDDWDRLVGTALHVRVSQPKTAQARIAEVKIGESRFTPNRTGILFETITPADGRLMIARRGFLPLVWRHTVTGKTQVGSYDVVYAVAPPDADPCDVSHWGDIYPITHAPYDARVNNRYLFAKLPFRDPGGALIPDGVDIKGTYPWMDKEAKLLSFQVSPAKLFPTYGYDGNPRSRYPLRCVSETDCGAEYQKDSDNSKDNLFAIIGGWTQGKMVLLDGLLNDVDFRLGGLDRNHSYLSLYRPGSGHDPNASGEVRVGSTRGATILYPVRDTDGNLLGRYKPANLSMFDSIENRLNHIANLKPTAFGDVVWTMSSGHSTENLIFDDYVNPNALIVSEMVAHLQHRNHDWYRMSYFDGWHQLTLSFNAQVRVQNSATTLPDQWQIPAYGRVYNGRLEPVANGGIRGKGLWFNGRNTRLQYDIPEQPRSVERNRWFYSLFIDPRFADDSEERLLMRFPDGSYITLAGLRHLQFYNSRRVQVWSVQLPQTLPSNAWSHLAFAVGAASNAVEGYPLQVFVNGFLAEQWQSTQFQGAVATSHFRPGTGQLQVGFDRHTPVAAFQGWLDEFKVYAHQPDIETICNLAHGSVIGLPDSYQGPWRALAARYPALAHQTVSRDLARYGQATYPLYACYHDYQGDDRAHLANLPDGTVSLRSAFHFPEGPLYHDAPRPDSTQNRFCLSCHHDQGVGGLTVAPALTLKPDLLARDDHRRQPMQPPARMYGNVPADWYAASPGPEGVAVDEWILPSSAGVAPKVLNLALANAAGMPWQAVADNGIDRRTLPAHIDQVRANVNGLVQRVEFVVNGQRLVVEAAPFRFPIAWLQDGDNQVSVTAHAPHGSVTEHFTLRVSPP